MTWLEKLKQKPVHVRDQIAFFSAGGMVAVLSLVWFLSVPSQMRNADTVAQGDQESQGGGSTLFGTIRQSFNDMTAQVGGALEKDTEPDSEDKTDSRTSVTIQPIDITGRSSTTSTTSATTTMSMDDDMDGGSASTSTSSATSAPVTADVTTKQPRTVQLVPVPTATTSASTSANDQ